MSSGFWREYKGELNSGETELLTHAKRLAVASKSWSTIVKYTGYWKRFCNWCSEYGNSALPASPASVGLFITKIALSAKSVSALDAHFYALKWAHNFCGEADPTDHQFPKMILEGAKRSLVSLTPEKNPITAPMIIQLCNRLCTDDATVRDLRFCAMAALSFSGFFRISEVLNLKSGDIVFFPDYFTVFIQSSKTDKYREGHTVHISQGVTVACPRKVLLHYLIRADALEADPGQFIFRRLIPLDSTRFKLAPLNRPLSYSRAREELAHFLSILGHEKKYTWHSFRHGGATAAAEAGVP